MKRRKLSALFLIGGFCAAGFAHGAAVYRNVIVANQIVHPLRVGAGGLSVERRIDRINERLNTIIAREPLAPSNIRIRFAGGDPAIFVGSHLVTSVTQADANANRMTKQQLAQRWLREYRRVLPQARPGNNSGVLER